MASPQLTQDLSPPEVPGYTDDVNGLFARLQPVTDELEAAATWVESTKNTAQTEKTATQTARDATETARDDAQSIKSDGLASAGDLRDQTQTLNDCAHALDNFVGSWDYATRTSQGQYAWSDTTLAWSDDSIAWDDGVVNFIPPVAVYRNGKIWSANKEIYNAEGDRKLPPGQSPDWDDTGLPNVIIGQAGDVMYAVEKPGADWEECDGAVYLQTTYPELYNVLGTGGSNPPFDPNTEFAVPLIEPLQQDNIGLWQPTVVRAYIRIVDASA
ncbi:hypothetical protein SLPG_00038 [Salicola phage CGphi29]|uniref:hypothetical protein n=1 Tax=Salicola phage CGphi29 TaxID=754067 RepID=UPI0002C14D4E|nr:hypothetical protein SLPG_00038 [Salicola phage CGphi29]AGH31832.1 hypothetical protein SLPG_00038 [Salicola phage CGphi29]